MEKYVIKGGCRLTGEVNISGAKNAAVAIIPATILADSPCRLENLPDISDVKTLTYILESMGAKVEYLDRHTVEIDPRTVDTDTVSADIARRIRASYYFLGALLGRCRKAVVPMPGGCNFGIRPIDQHLKGFAALGCDYSLDNGMISVSAPQDLHGASVYMDVVTVGATMNIMLAAVKARGLTVIENAAREPHIVDLANFLNTLGADIRGAGTDTIKIHGVQKLRGATYSIIPDQIEAGTYMVAAAATGGDVTVKNVTPKHLESISAKLVECSGTERVRPAASWSRRPRSHTRRGPSRSPGPSRSRRRRARVGWRRRRSRPAAARRRGRSRGRVPRCAAAADRSSSAPRWDAV